MSIILCHVVNRSVTVAYNVTYLTDHVMFQPGPSLISTLSRPCIIKIWNRDYIIVSGKDEQVVCDL